MNSFKKAYLFPFYSLYSKEQRCYIELKKTDIQITHLSLETSNQGKQQLVLGQIAIAAFSVRKRKQKSEVQYSN